MALDVYSFDNGRARPKHESGDDMNKRNFEPMSRRERAAQYRVAAQECEAAGFPGMAEVNREAAEELTPRDVTDADGNSQD